jgi:hypothetical protein
LSIINGGAPDLPQEMNHGGQRTLRDDHRDTAPSGQVAAATEIERSTFGWLITLAAMTAEPDSNGSEPRDMPRRQQKHLRWPETLGRTVSDALAQPGSQKVRA